MKLSVEIEYDPNGHDDHSGLIEFIVGAVTVALNALAKFGVIGGGFSANVTHPS